MLSEVAVEQLSIQGLPSFEMPISDLIPDLQNQLLPLDQAYIAATGTDGFNNAPSYTADIFFEGTSVYFRLPGKHFILY